MGHGAAWVSKGHDTTWVSKGHGAVSLRHDAAWVSMGHGAAWVSKGHDAAWVSKGHGAVSLRHDAAWVLMGHGAAWVSKGHNAAWVSKGRNATLGEIVENTIQTGITKLSSALQNSLAEQSKLQNTAEALDASANSLNKIAMDMCKSITDATTVTSQITKTAVTYKEALLSTNTRPVLAPACPPPPTQSQDQEYSLQIGLERKARQILLDSATQEGHCFSTHKIKEKAEKALANMTPLPPAATKIQEVMKLKNGSIIIQFDTKEAADWIREPTNEAIFTKDFDPDTSIRKRVHPVVIPRIPTTFDPGNPEHLQEIKLANRIPDKNIKAARWIKPEYRRMPGQRFAHAIFSFSSAAEANRALRDCLYICNVRTFPKKLKFEPKQCMKCQKWGHYAAECHAQYDTCGTCGNKHKTKDCTEEYKRFCIPCKADTQASWDRDCPEFRRKCKEYNGFHPENNLVYFPTEEDWMLTTCPYRIPFEEKFPECFAVASLPPPNRTEHQLPTCPIAKKNKPWKQNRANGQAVMENFFDTRINTQGDQAAPANHNTGVDEDEDT
ncbi:hypothetical protein EDB84DRAFT_1557007 [Lactarius hengduanensis]|nr:hypothetical protein EDB84DRAFT_1557007 [Lactarius hengduanensis]